jgi:signal transduction histidine kinase
MARGLRFITLEVPCPILERAMIPGPSPPKPTFSEPAGVSQFDTPLGAVMRALEGNGDGTLARALCALALDEAGPGFERVHVLEFDSRRNALRLWASLAREAQGAPAPSLATASRAELRPDVLLGAPAESWRTGRPAVSEAAPVQTDAWWPTSGPLGAITLEAPHRRIGLLVGEWSDTPGEEPRGAQLEPFAVRVNDLLRAIVRGARERRRSAHAAALAEFARNSLSALNVAEAFHLAARLACEATGSRGGAIWRAGNAGAPMPEVTFGVVAERERIARGLQGLIGTVMNVGRTRVLDRATDEALLTPDVAAQIETLAALPVRAYGRVIGALAVYDRSPRGMLEPGTYDEVELGFLATLADILGLVMEQAARSDELRLAALQTRELGSRLAREERLASLGELASRVAGEARNPLASIGAFARRVHRELPEDSPHREYLEIVIRESERLERIVGAPLDRMPAEPLRLLVENLNRPLQDVLRNAGETLVRRRVRLLKKLAPDLPRLLIDADRIHAALANILQHALEAVPIGGRIRVESRRTGGFAVVEIAHDGPRAPGDLLEQLFVPFSNLVSGEGLGLALARQVIQAHGGEIRVRSEAEWTAVVSLTLPIRDNEDRRSAPVERRHVRADRRRRSPSE